MNRTSPPPAVEDLLSELIAIPSVNPMGRDLNPAILYEARMADWLEAFFRSIGAPYERWDVVPGRPNIIARYDAPQSDITILLDAHLDTVPVDGMTVPPFQAALQNGRITGRGSADVKGGLAAMLHAFRRLVEERPAGSANVVLSCCCDEEATTLGIHSLIDSCQSGRLKLLPNAPDFAIIAEPTSLDVVVAHRGVLRFRIRTTGQACHSSDPSKGTNAIYRMARVVTVLEDYARRLASSSPHSLCGAPSLSVGRIVGGISANIVPDACSIEVDLRPIPRASLPTALDTLKAFVTERLDFAVEFETPWIECPALSDESNGPLANAVLAHIDAIAGPRRTIGVPFGTHAAWTAAAGIPSVVFGPGHIAQAHTGDEWIEVTQLRQAAEAYFRICAKSSSG